MPSLFDPLDVKGITLRNRIVASPMCQYQAQDGLLNEWHQVHYASLARGGVGLVIVEATDSFADSLQVLRWAKSAGLDLVDVGLAGSTPGEQVPWGPDFMVPYAARVRRETGLAVATSWMITDARQADAFVREGQLDLVLFARTLLANPHWTYHAALALGVNAPQSVLPTPYAYWLQNWSA